ncbi:Hypothetical predicted protein [Marmota monax]|uniref:Ig-like domain-containing protein n=1 Tax=Marmota monax TaxID=9995 RepID=A0A5E4AQ12_MARMO|nr:Hypothetical predicted protein [Marmota monax]
MSFLNERAADKSGMPSERFSAERPQGSFSTLEIQLTVQGDSAVYLCASSSATVWHRLLLPAHRPLCSALLMFSEALQEGVASLFPKEGKEGICTFRGSSSRRREKGGAKSLLSAQETSTLSAKMLRPVLPDPAWGPRLLCCITLCLLGAGSVDAEVILFPRHLIRAKGGKGTLKCYPMSGHNRVFWYQQAPGQGPQFLVEYFEKMQRNKGNLPDRFSAQQFDDYHSELNMSSLELGDSATYLCASSLHSPAESLAFCTVTFLSQLRVF